MKLIATLGATPISNKHIYKIDSKEYKVELSFLALKKHFNIKDKDVYIIGTSQTKKKLGDFIAKFNFINIDKDSLETVFKEAINIIENEDIIDLTQGYRSFPYGVFLSINFSKHLDKEPLDIFYAQIEDANCNYGNGICSHKFISLKTYNQIAELSRIINTFLVSWYVIDEEKTIFKNLHKLSKKLLVNDINVKDEINKIKSDIDKFKTDMPFLQTHLEKLEKEIKTIEQNIKLMIEYKKLLNFSNLYYEKNLLLQSLTFLFEAILAYLDQKYLLRYFQNCKKSQYDINKEANIYERRNCIKKVFVNSKRKLGIQKENELKLLLKNIDRLRNQSAHAFINENSSKDFKEEIKKSINLAKQILI